MKLIKVKTHTSLCIEHCNYEGVCMHCVAEAINHLIDELEQVKTAIRQLVHADTEG